MSCLDRDFLCISSTSVTRSRPDQRLKSSYPLQLSSKNYIVSPADTIVSAKHHHPYTSITYTCSQNKSHIHHDNQPKPPLCSGTHLQSVCPGFVPSYHYRYSTWAAQNSGTPKRSSSWLYQRHQDFHVQDVRWSCAERVSDLLPLFCDLSFACGCANADAES